MIQTSLGISVVPNEGFVRLKRYNLHEIMHPGLKAELEQKKKNRGKPAEKVNEGGIVPEEVKKQTEGPADTNEKLKD